MWVCDRPARPCLKLGKFCSSHKLLCRPIPGVNIFFENCLSVLLLKPRPGRDGTLLFQLSTAPLRLPGFIFQIACPRLCCVTVPSRLRQDVLQIFNFFLPWRHLDAPTPHGVFEIIRIHVPNPLPEIDLLDAVGWGSGVFLAARRFFAQKR